ncbi:hypothetical protein R50073_00210 [Maricurvus nonylphenolicus]|uniref:c-type cytochrome n=1 Tax=Maricurvus nonylphenolicus TaxID=1008307 RepID=UPI0036F3730C
MKSVWIGVIAALTLSAAVQAEDVVEGQALYQKHCAMCHGPKGLGDGPAGKALKAANIAEEIEEHKGDEAHLIEEVMEGEGAMPAWKGVLSTQQVKNILAYIKGIQ